MPGQGQRPRYPPPSGLRADSGPCHQQTAWPSGLGHGWDTNLPQASPSPLDRLGSAPDPVLTSPAKPGTQPGADSGIRVHTHFT